ncbi:MAG: ECF transporter S component [Bacillota bacterium]|nr:ECF transporter S component [Bacillota bacterium]
MQKKSLINILIIIILVPAALIITWKLGDRQYWLSSVTVIILAMVPFFVSFEKRKPTAREMVTLATMCAIAVASRVAFIMVPNFKPMLGIVMIVGISLGAEAGFLTGAIGALVSNFIFGQGPWTPWQMFAYGLSGFIAGLLAKAGIMKPERRFSSAIIGGFMIFLLIGPVLDTCSVFLMSTMYNPDASILAIYAAGVPVNAVHGLAVALTLFILCKPMCEKLDRIKNKYGMLQ